MSILGCKTAQIPVKNNFLLPAAASIRLSQTTFGSPQALSRSFVPTSLVVQSPNLWII